VSLLDCELGINPSMRNNEMVTVKARTYAMLDQDDTIRDVK
jgi:hypothetical protein